MGDVSPRVGEIKQVRRREPLNDWTPIILHRCGGLLMRKKSNEIRNFQDGKRKDIRKKHHSKYNKISRIREQRKSCFQRIQNRL